MSRQQRDWRNYRPRRNESGMATRVDIRNDTDAERLCRILLGLVEDMGASEPLTRAVIAIDEARNYIADHVETVHTASEPEPTS